MIKHALLFVSALLLTGAAVASEALPLAVGQTGPQVGDCAIFREGGGGRIFKAPTYWLKGTIDGVARERRLAGRCPQIARPLAAYTRDDWLRVAAATPCVQTDAEVQEVNVLRIKISVNDWETPWSHQHGATGWLFRGYFLDTPLKKGQIIDMDASWLEHCEPRQ